MGKVCCIMLTDHGYAPCAINVFSYSFFGSSFSFHLPFFLLKVRTSDELRAN